MRPYILVCMALLALTGCAKEPDFAQRQREAELDVLRDLEAGIKPLEECTELKFMEVFNRYLEYFREYEDTREGRAAYNRAMWLRKSFEATHPEVRIGYHLR